ncbi:MAG: zinc-ribbon domain-containing protein [Rickettsiaceae bacterium]|nr:zinc-ribbon domain-containing protein [Rickettsiaceae bacterium]
MYIACPECDTKFVVTPEQIGKEGRKVKCSKCSHVWHHKLANQLRIEPIITQPIATTPLGNGINLPALLPIKIQPYLYVMPIVMIGLIILMLIMVFPTSLGINTLLNSNNLSIKDVQVQNQKDLDKITISYKVHNSAPTIVKMPLVRIRFFDKNGKIVESKIDDQNSNVEMSPNQFIQIKTELMPAPSAVDSIDIMIGNKIDFILR